MAKVNVEKLDEQKKIAILKKAIDKLGLSYVSRQIGVDRSTLNRYVNGKIKKIPNEVIEKASDLLTVEELNDILYGLKSTDVDPTTAISVIVKAKTDESFRNFFLTLLWQELGEYIKEPSNTYVVSDDDIKLFEKIMKTQRAKKTAYMRTNSLKRALAELNYELTPTRLKEYMLDVLQESKGRAENVGKALKLFIKEVIKPKNPRIARELYDAVKIPKYEREYTPINLELETVKQIFNAIEGLGAKAYFLILAETGLRTGEVFSLRLDQVDLENRVIRIGKVTKTKRAYVTFIHQPTVEWLKETYLPYRERFVRRYANSLKALNVNIEQWEAKLFPFDEDDIRTEIKIAMRKVIGREFRLYDLRSFFASYMLKQGVSPLVVNVLQGRTPPQQFQILQERYLNLSEKELQEIYDKHAPRLL
ncbi:tyrosine-type recombinase/integrase [Sulfurisphaera tokodaii]|uniref:Transposase n=2 Tax=Sulfurisphaera tokodaii TaxID=111955 RepID=Q96XM0_SULTO|nr:tyrosine-type recombinase/integrase [Sulfurisphaera tokodaii]BAB67607.1 putative transposase [Sulfurisphaera tokodaii str. 7]HII75291.1 tyrosine-type recombinase/integrase [Sulfurisphaera tokodaii]